MASGWEKYKYFILLLVTYTEICCTAASLGPGWRYARIPRPVPQGWGCVLTPSAVYNIKL